MRTTRTFYNIVYLLYYTQLWYGILVSKLFFNYPTINKRRGIHFKIKWRDRIVPK